MGTFEHNGFTFGIDKKGVTVEGGHTVELDIDYGDIGVRDDEAAMAISARLTELCGEPVEDDEGVFDIAVWRGTSAVAFLQLSCDDDVLEVDGERSGDLTDDALATALVEALRPADAVVD